MSTMITITRTGRHSWTRGRFWTLVLTLAAFCASEGYFSTVDAAVLERLKYCFTKSSSKSCSTEYTCGTSEGDGWSEAQGVEFCAECSTCNGFVRLTNGLTRFLTNADQSCSGGSWYAYRDKSYCGAISNNDFKTHVTGCLSEAPWDGMCYEYGYENNIGPMPHWDVSDVTDMSEAFMGKHTFVDLSNWDVSKVTNMKSMFYGATISNPSIFNIGSWDVSKVENMNRMFYNAQAFKQNIGNWNVASVENMALMFYKAFNFNGNIGNWNVASVEDMYRMFYEAKAFTQNIKNWNVASVENMKSMFYGASSFNADISSWDVASVTDMEEMFKQATSFNHFVGGWTENSALTTTNMFKDATAFLAKYTSASCSDSAKPSACRVPLTDSTFKTAITNCLAESSTTGECKTYGASSGYGVMSD